MNKTLTLTLLTLALCLTSTFDQVRAQARYDDHELRDRFRITLGGFGTNNTSTKIRIDSNNRVLGTLIDLEDGLNVEDSATVARLDGFYRFNRAHRIEWTAYSLTRNGRKTLNTSRTIGGTVYPVGFSLDSEWKLKINKPNNAMIWLGYADAISYLLTKDVNLSGFTHRSGGPDCRPCGP